MAKKRQYTDEFKREAVKLVTEQGYTQAEAARSLGINPNLIRNWRRKFALQNAGTETMSETEQQELIRLREEVRRLRMERDILKKATAFFASEKS
jgi:transposase